MRSYFPTPTTKPGFNIVARFPKDGTLKVIWLLLVDGTGIGTNTGNGSLNNLPSLV